ncbi:choline oxidase [Planoprotostelium fungivorum]|uniref:Choline oxidase n=1 Tax=Planoprotostelium fungivorum TaxID=1890364 RepID=A0A2P6N529_9EUKA|nr:choline oxidase [Planoprotostelium fungivorum]
MTGESGSLVPYSLFHVSNLLRGIELQRPQSFPISNNHSKPVPTQSVNMKCTALLIALLCILSLANALFDDVEVFDYLIVGGGAAGSLMASRLSEDPSKTVLVCSACDDGTSSGAENILNAGLYTRNGADYFTTTQLFTQRNIREVRSNLPGGGTRLYGAINIPSSKNLIDKTWPAGLKYNTMLPYLNKLQDHFCHYLPFSQTNITAEECTTYHGRPSPIGMSISPPVPGPDTAIAQDLFNVVPQSNISVVPDPWNPNYQSKGSYLWPTHYFHNRAVANDINSKRTRESTWTGFLPLTLRQQRRNLVFRTESEGRELIYAKDLALFPGIRARLGLNLFSGLNPTPRVVGVKYEKDGDFQYAFAKRQVIISAGVEGTPHLLQANGIGPADLLTSLGIPVVVNNPAVGQNIAAHQAVTIAFQAKQAIPVTSNQAASVRGLLSSPFNQGFPDLEIEFLFGLSVDKLDVAFDGIDPYYFSTPSVNGAFPAISVLLEDVNPQWRGSINITSKKFHANSQVEYGWPKDGAGYATSVDYQKLSWAYQKIRGIFLGNNSFSSKHIVAETIPGNPALDLIHSAQVQHSIYHTTGGLNIGTATDLTGAVKGLTGLTVCDNSLIPHPPNGNPTTTMLALCEYVADQIKLRA